MTLIESGFADKKYPKLPKSQGQAGAISNQFGATGKIMKRRKFVGNAVIGATGTVALAGCRQTTTSTAVQSGSQPRIRWRMATSWPTSLDTILGGAKTISQRVSEMTNGRFTITPFAAGEIVPGLQVLDAVQTGTVQCGHTASYYYIGKNPALAFGTAVPFGLDAQQQNAWLYHGGGLEAMQKLYTDFGVINFPAGNTGTQMGGWFKREVNSVADLNGLKMRIPGLGGEVMSRLGVNVQVLPGGEIYLALERGAIDAAEWVGPYDDEKLGLDQAAQFYYYPGWWEPASARSRRGARPGRGPGRASAPATPSTPRRIPASRPPPRSRARSAHPRPRWKGTGDSRTR